MNSTEPMRVARRARPQHGNYVPVVPTSLPKSPQKNYRGATFLSYTSVFPDSTPGRVCCVQVSRRRYNAEVFSASHTHHAGAPPGSASQYVVVDLGTVGSYSASAIAINNAGQVAGNFVDSSFNPVGAYVTKPNQTITASDLLPLLPGGTHSSVNFNSVNNLGQVAAYGDRTSPTAFSRAYRVDTDGSVHDLGTLGGNANTNAWGINDLGQVTGQSIPLTIALCGALTQDHAYRTASNSPMTAASDLGTVLPNNCRYSIGFGINSSGQVVGYSATGSLLSPQSHAMLASPASSMKDLGTIVGPFSLAYAITS